MKTALITGITGQDGSYLAELLLEKGYTVHGVVRRSSTMNRQRIDHLHGAHHHGDARLMLHYADLSDSSSINRLVERTQPDEVYNLAAQSHVKVSFDIPEYSADVNALGTLRLLDAIRKTGASTRFYQASTSELFGKVRTVPQDENTPFYPRSPYAVSKLFAYWSVVNYRESYALFAVNGILFNHESPRRGENFVTRKISISAARIRKGLQDCLMLGNLDARRDWGYAPEYVDAMWRMLQQADPVDLVIATGETHTVREFCTAVFDEVGLPLTWEGEGIDEVGKDANGIVRVCVDPAFYRPAEVDLLIGNANRAWELLGWRPQVTFSELARLMARADMANNI